MVEPPQLALRETFETVCECACTPSPPATALSPWCFMKRITDGTWVGTHGDRPRRSQLSLTATRRGTSKGVRNGQTSPGRDGDWCGDHDDGRGGDWCGAHDDGRG